jgi:hypothetical protein
LFFNYLGSFLSPEIPFSLLRISATNTKEIRLSQTSTGNPVRHGLQHTVARAEPKRESPAVASGAPLSAT